MPLISLLVEWAQPKKESINLNITSIKLLLFLYSYRKIAYGRKFRKYTLDKKK